MQTTSKTHFFETFVLSPGLDADINVVSEAIAVHTSEICFKSYLEAVPVETKFRKEVSMRWPARDNGLGANLIYLISG